MNFFNLRSYSVRIHSYRILNELAALLKPFDGISTFDLTDRFSKLISDFFIWYTDSFIHIMISQIA